MVTRYLLRGKVILKRHAHFPLRNSRNALIARWTKESINARASYDVIARQHCRSVKGIFSEKTHISTTVLRLHARIQVSYRIRLALGIRSAIVRVLPW
jgi:hypothetical protein